MLPPKVHQKGPSLYYVHRNRWIRLCRADDPEHVLYNELAKLKRRGDGTLKSVLSDYRDNALKELAFSTQSEYERMIDTRLIPVFGHMHPDEVTGSHIAQYLQKRQDEGARVIANREVAVLSSAFNYAMRKGLASINPTYGVRRNKERPRTRYVENWELRKALRKAPKGLRYLIWAAYLTGLRQKDLRELKKQQVTPDGIEVRQSKDGKHVLIELTPSLERCLRRSQGLSDGLFVFVNSRGAGWSKEALKTAWRRLDVGFTFHDLRAKAESDHETGMGLMTRYKRARRIRAVR